MKHTLLAQRLLALAAAGWLVFDFPLAQLWVTNPVRVFVLWAALIAAVAWLLERRDD